ncbi:MAG: Subversion of eukaryotic traffic protein A [Chlamydiae bacterium]|nr:Subversion of eukaryotic traffic protein A [Chlamydiota bacterium]
MKKEVIILLFICPIVFFYVFSHTMKFGKRDPKVHVTLEDSFEKLQGSETENWNYIQTRRDYDDLDRYKALYKKNYKHQFNSNPSFKIPKSVHIIWIGPKSFPSDSVENIRTWMAHHPDWTFNFWTDRKRPAPCNGMKICMLDDFNFEFLEEKYEESSNWGEKADIWRYEILYQQGGVYIDHDVTCFRPFHGLHTGYDFYSGLEMPHEGIDSLALTVGISIIGTKARHPVLRRTIQLVLDRWDAVTKKFSTSDPLVQARRVTHRTLIAMTYASRTGLNQPGNIDIIFPACYFYPKGALPSFYSVHQYGTTWNNLNETPGERFFQKKLRHLRNRDAKIIRVELMTLFAMIGCFILYFLINRELKKKRKP